MKNVKRILAGLAVATLGVAIIAFAGPSFVMTP